MMTMMHLLGNLSFFFLVVCTVTLCGLGLVQVFGLRTFKHRILVAPSLAISVSAIAVSLVVISGTPVGIASPLLWLFWVLLTAYGASGVSSALKDLDRKNALWISVLATVVACGGFIWYGPPDYLGSPALDGWSYVSFGEYLLHYPKGTEGGLAPVYQYAAHLSGTRFAASAMLGALIPPWSREIDTQMTVGPLLILAVYGFASSVEYAAQTANQRGLVAPVWLAVILGVIGGWLPYALRVNNYDNLLALSFAPMLFGLASDRDLSRFGQIFLPALFVSASLYTYPELSPLIVAAYGAVVADNFFSALADKQNPLTERFQVFNYVSVAVIALLIVSPYLQDLWRFWGLQLSATGKIAGRPGEGIEPSLLDSARVWGAMWGLGSEPLGTVIGILLGPIALCGAVAALKRKALSINLYLVLTFALFVVMIKVNHYDYGGYKILLVGWWATAIVLAAGARDIWVAVMPCDFANRNFLTALAIATIGSAISLWLAQQYHWTRGYRYKTALEAREARDAVAACRGPVQVAIADPTLNAWLVYELRDAVALFTELHGYMDQAHVRPLMARSKVPTQGETQCLLTDADRLALGAVAWQNNVLKLIRRSPEEELSGITIKAPNGRETLDGYPFFWLGREPASIVLSTSRSRAVRLDFEAIVGPSIGASLKDYPKAAVRDANGQSLVIDTQSVGIHTMRIPLSPGLNEVVIRAEYDGSVIPNSNGDPRILLVGIKLIKVAVDDN